MNEAMTVSPRAVRMLAEFEGKPRLKAKRCPGGVYELSYGCTTWPPGADGVERPVGPTDTCTEDQALQLFAYHLTKFEGVVEREIKVPLKQHQYDALVICAYNMGAKRFADSSVAEAINHENGPRWHEAAEAMTLYKYSVIEPHECPEDHPEWCLSPDGQPCNYRRQLRGLIRRYAACACMILGYDHTQAVADDPDRVRANDAIRLRTKFMWNVKEGYNEDITLEQTPWEDTLEIARRHPLPAVTEAKAPTVAAGKPVAEGAPSGRPAPPPAPTPAPAPRMPANLPSVTPPIPHRPPSKLEQTRRFWGAFIFYGGRVLCALAFTTLPGKFAVAFGEVYGAVVKDPVLFGYAIDAMVFSTGFVCDCCGGWLRKWGERRARGQIVSDAEHHRLAQQAQPQTQVVITAETLQRSTEKLIVGGV